MPEVRNSTSTEIQSWKKKNFVFDLARLVELYNTEASVMHVGDTVTQKNFAED